MKARIDKLETDVERLDKEVVGLRDFRHAANGTLHTHDGKLEAIEGQHKSLVSELVGIRQDLKEWMTKTNGLLTWQLKIKFMLAGGVGVAGTGLALMSAAYYILKMYLDYHK